MISNPRRAAAAAATAVALGLGLAPNAPLADTVVLKNGRRQTGVVLDDGGTSGFLELRTTGATLKIDKANIAEVLRDPPSASWMALGDEYMSRNRVEEALECFQKAASLDPNNAEAKQRLRAAETEVAGKRSSELETERQTSLKLLEEARALAAERKFDEAAGKIAAAESRGGSLVAEDARVAYGELYYAWGLSWVDRLNDKRGAEMLEKALTYAPGRPEYRDALVRVYEKIPEKAPEVLAHYKKRLEENPADATLRIKTARLMYDQKEFKEAANLLLLTADQGAIRSQADMSLLENALWQVVSIANDARDYREARGYMARLIQYFPQYDNGSINYLDYYIKLGDIDEQNPYDHLEMAKFSQERLLDDMAMTHFSKALALKPDMEEAREALRLIANKELNEARALLEGGSLLLAIARAQRLQAQFPLSPDIVAEARVVAEKATIRLEEQSREKNKIAQDTARAGDDYYARAQGYMSEFQSTDFDDNRRVYSPTEEAKRYLRRAIDAWEQALQLDPSLAEIAKGDYRTKISDANRELSILTGGSLGFTYRTREYYRSRDRNTSTSSTGSSATGVPRANTSTSSSGNSGSNTSSGNSSSSGSSGRGR